MIKIKNYKFDTDIKNIIDKLKLETAKKGKNLFKDIIDRDKFISVTCPYHKNGHESKPSAGFSTTNGYFNCFTCSEKHPLDEVVAYCLDMSSSEAFEWIKENFSFDENTKNHNFMQLKKEKAPKEFITDITKYRVFHPYMFKRKLTKDIIRKYDVGYDKESNCLVFPNKDEDGNILFLAKRSVKTKFFNYPKNVDKPIYGLYELQRDEPSTKSVIICESMINCLTCRTWGYPAVALNGTGSSEQLAKLSKLQYTTYILALDGDDAGRKGTDKIIKKLENKKILYVLDIPEGKDVNDLEKDEFEHIYNNRVGVIKYKTRRAKELKNMKIKGEKYA